MDVSAIIAKSRVQTNTSVGQKSDALMLVDLNTVHGTIFGVLNTKSKKYTRQTYKTATVVGQNEYNIPKQTVTETGLARVLNVQVKYSSDGEYIPLKMYDTSLAVDSKYNNENTPYCINRDDSIFIYPAPSAVVTDGIVIEGNYQPLPLTLASTSAAIKLAADNHDLLVYGLNMRTFGDKQLFDKQALYKNLFDTGLQELVLQGGADIESGYVTSNEEIYNQSRVFLP